MAPKKVGLPLAAIDNMSDKAKEQLSERAPHVVTDPKLINRVVDVTDGGHFSGTSANDYFVLDFKQMNSNSTIAEIENFDFNSDKIVIENYQVSSALSKYHDNGNSTTYLTNYDSGSTSASTYNYDTRNDFGVEIPDWVSEEVWIRASIGDTGTSIVLKDADYRANSPAFDFLRSSMIRTQGDFEI
jgi:hypothetical protein